MVQNCRQCGLALPVDGDPQRILCYATKKLIAPEEQQHEWQCLYYIKPIVEDGRPLTAGQHYLLKCTELEHKK